MSTSTLTRPPAWFASDNTPGTTFTGHQFTQNADGSADVQNVEVFKSGTFRDSLGDQQTWLPEHLVQMTQNYNLLKANNIFANVPVRRDHSMSIDKVMGYVNGLHTDGQKLFADIHITEPTDVEKLVRGTYRSRSLEVGMYVDNSEAAFWPVVFGVAYVDIAAVEGLFSKSNEISYFSLIPQGEGNMAIQNGQQVADRPPQTTINVFGSGQQPDQSSTVPTPPTPPTPPVPQPQPAPAPTPPAQFRINGADTVDFAAVQRHIDVLEGTLKTVNEDSRKSFVADLAKTNKIVAAQVTPLEAFALSLDATSYDAWRKTFEGAQALSMLGNHGGAGNTDPNAGADRDQTAEAISVQKEIVAQLHRVMKPEQVEKTAAFRKLTELTAPKS